MATNVTNAQIAEALRGLGFNIPPDMDLTGAQNSQWKLKLLNVLRPMVPQGQYGEDIFNRAKDTARKLADIKPDASQLDKMSQTLSAYGVGGEQYSAIIKEAERIRKTSGPGIYDPSKPFNENEWGQAAANLLGNTPMVQAAFRAGGMTAPPAPAEGSQGAKVAPAASVAQMPVAPAAGGVTMGTTKSRATPGVKAPDTTPASAGVAAGGLVGPGGGGGMPNNQPPSPATWNDDQIKTFIKQNFGSNAYFVDIPEVWSALKDVIKSGKGVNGLEPALEGTQFWRQNGVNARSWYVKERADPAQAAADIAQQTQAITNIAQQAGITLDPERASQMASSYLRYGWTQTDLQRAIGAEWHYDPSSKTQAAAVTKMKDDARHWLVPLSDQAIQTWGQGVISGSTTQEQFQQYLRDNAKSLLPQLSDLIDAHQGDPNFTVDTFVDPYRQHAAQLLGIQPDQVDFNDSKWRKALDTHDPKTGQRRIMSLGEWESTIKSDSTYGYDQSSNGIKDGLNLANALKTSMGY